MVQDIELKKEVDISADYVELKVEMEKWETHMQTWFTLDNDFEIGADYVGVQKL